MFIVYNNLIPPYRVCISLSYIIMCSPHLRKNIITACKKAIGTLEHIMQEANAEATCTELMTQMNSVVGMVESQKKILLKDYLESCIDDQLQVNKAGVVRELLKIYNIHE